MSKPPVCTLSMPTSSVPNVTASSAYQTAVIIHCFLRYLQSYKPLCNFIVPSFLSFQITELISDSTNCAIICWWILHSVYFCIKMLLLWLLGSQHHRGQSFNNSICFTFSVCGIVAVEVLRHINQNCQPRRCDEHQICLWPGKTSARPEANNMLWK